MREREREKAGRMREKAWRKERDREHRKEVERGSERSSKRRGGLEREKGA